jgi:hypothetical protein
MLSDPSKHRITSATLALLIVAKWSSRDKIGTRQKGAQSLQWRWEEAATEVKNSSATCARQQLLDPRSLFLFGNATRGGSTLSHFGMAVSEMSPFPVAVAIFLLMILGTIVGLALNPVLEAHHLSENYKELLRGNRSVIVQLLAVTLGLLIAQSLSSFEQKSGVLKAQASDIIALDHVLKQFGVGAEGAKAELHKAISDEIAKIEATVKNESEASHEVARIAMEPLRGSLLNLSPKNANQDYLKTRALALGEEIISARWKIYEQMNSEIQWPLVAVFVFWLVTVYFSFGVLTPRDGVLMVGLFLSALSLAAAVYLVIELDTPYQGLVSISSKPLKSAINHLDFSR